MAYVHTGKQMVRLSPSRVQCPHCFGVFSSKTIHANHVITDARTGERRCMTQQERVTANLWPLKNGIWGLRPRTIAKAEALKRVAKATTPRRKK